jgi:hypothetical protein
MRSIVRSVVSSSTRVGGMAMGMRVGPMVMNANRTCVPLTSSSTSTLAAIGNNRSLSVMTAAARAEQRRFERDSGLLPNNDEKDKKTGSGSSSNNNEEKGGPNSPTGESSSVTWRDFYLRMYDYAPVALFIAAAGGFYTYSEVWYYIRTDTIHC